QRSAHRERRRRWRACPTPAPTGIAGPLDGPSRGLQAAQGAAAGGGQIGAHIAGVAPVAAAKACSSRRRGQNVRPPLSAPGGVYAEQVQRVLVVGVEAPRGALHANAQVTSAESCRLVGNSEVVFMGTREMSTDSISDFVGAEQASRLDNGALAMDPLGLNGIEPGTLDRQVARQNAYAPALLLDLPV